MQLVAISVTASYAADAHNSLLTCHPHLAEVIEDSHALELLHLAVQAPQGHSRSQLLERLIHELDLLACGQEHDDLGAQVCFDEGPEHVDLLVQLTDDVSLQHDASDHQPLCSRL